MPPVIIDSKLSDTASYNAWVGTRQELYILLEWGILRQSKNIHFLSDPTHTWGPINGFHSMKLTIPFADLTDVNLADEDTNSILTILTDLCLLLIMPEKSQNV